jgi:hypothetical protein
MHTALARMLDAEIRGYKLRSLTTGRGENLLTEDNAPQRIWQGNSLPGSDSELDVGQVGCRCRPGSGIVRLSLAAI